MINSWRQSAVVAATLVAAAAIAIALQAWSLQSPPTNPTSAEAATSVRVVEGVQGGSALNTSFSTAKEALAYASSKAGFDVAMPTYLPHGYALATIGIPPNPPAGLVASGRPHTVQLTVRNGSSGFTIMDVNTTFRFASDDASHIIARPSAGSAIYKSDPSNRADGNNGWDYTLLTPTRGADLIVRVNQLTDDQAIRILSSMPQN